VKDVKARGLLWRRVPLTLNVEMRKIYVNCYNYLNTIL